MIAVILESGDPARIYTALSLLVSTAAEGEPARGLVSFGALRALHGEAPADGVFGRSLAELRATAIEVEDCRLWACAAAVETTGLAPDGALIEGVMSTPRFLKVTAGARLVVV
jgi:peroxiredoxin family protein